MCQSRHCTDAGCVCLGRRDGLPIGRTDVQSATHVEMEPDKMGNHSNYRGVAVFQIGFDEKGRVTGADAISGQPLGISHLMAAVSRWKFKPAVVNGMKKRGCGKLWIRFAMRENVPSAEVLKGPAKD
jgi:hypothetical protein